MNRGFGVHPSGCRPGPNTLKRGHQTAPFGSWSQCLRESERGLSMNRRIEHRDWEDTEPEDLAALWVLPISALRPGSASHTPPFMAAMRVQSWRSRLPIP